MSEINVPSNQRDAIKSIDVSLLRAMVDQCLREERSYALRDLRLEDCGPYVGRRLREYAQSLSDYSTAKAAKKRESTRYSALVAGSNLMAAVEQMKDRVETEERDGRLFRVEDLMPTPGILSDRLSVRVSYRWRRAVENDWTFGDITFLHDVDMRPDYTTPIAKRKPSASQAAALRRQKLNSEWEHLRVLALHSVKEYFKNDGAGDSIPKTFEVITDPYSRVLNNFSANFWTERRSV